VTKAAAEKRPVQEWTRQVRTAVFVDGYGGWLAQRGLRKELFIFCQSRDGLAYDGH